jgi:hypothetical protein
MIARTLSVGCPGARGVSVVRQVHRREGRKGVKISQEEGRREEGFPGGKVVREDASGVGNLQDLDEFMP